MALEKEPTNTANSLNILTGIWLIASPFILGFAKTASSTNAIVIGIIVAVVALVRLLSSGPSSQWLNWVNVIMGVWLIISSTIIGYATVGALWNSIILGILVIIFSAWGSESAEEKMA